METSRCATRGRKRSINGSGGFTLVELIIVIAIISILTVTLAPNMVKWVDKSRWSKDQADAIMLTGEVQTAIIDITSHDKSPGSGTITLTRDADPAVVGASKELTDELTRMDARWQHLRVTNHGSADGSKAVYTITFDDKSATGGWS